MPPPPSGQALWDGGIERANKPADKRATPGMHGPEDLVRPGCAENAQSCVYDASCWCAFADVDGCAGQACRLLRVRVAGKPPQPTAYLCLASSMAVSIDAQALIYAGEQLADGAKTLAAYHVPPVTHGGEGTLAPALQRA